MSTLIYVALIFAPAILILVLTWIMKSVALKLSDNAQSARQFKRRIAE